jgi:cation:H+ antiporter
LTGFGWPLILFTLFVQRRRNGRTGPTTIALRPEQSIELIFLLGASLYYVWILIEGVLTLIDSLILGATFIAYMWILSRIPTERGNQKEEVEGPSLALAEIKSKRKKIALITGLFLFGGLTFVLITDAFVESVRIIAETFLAGLLGSGAVFFSIQWIAPVLSEFPEKVTAFNWARRITLAPVALLNFISSAVNELTALVALIPIVFVVSRGAIEPVPVQGHSVEILLTMAQSLYAFATLLDLEYSVDNALVLLVLWGVSTALVDARLWIAIIFLIMAAFEAVRTRGRITVFSAFKQTLRDCFRRDGRKDRD